MVGGRKDCLRLEKGTESYFYPGKGGKGLGEKRERLIFAKKKKRKGANYVIT